MVPIIIRKRAAKDLADAKEWYEGERPGLGAELEDLILSALRQIQGMPLVHPVVTGNVRRLVLRQFPYSIFYRVKANHISVIAIYHHRRDPRHWQDRV